MKEPRLNKIGERVILLVEDNPDDVELILRSLKKHNISNEVVVVHDGAEALEYLFAAGAYAGRDASIIPAVILLDLKLPKMDGLESRTHIRRQWQDIRSSRYSLESVTETEYHADGDNGLPALGV